jgi:hypothetical protein
VFGYAYDATGASNVKTLYAVPATAATVTITCECKAFTVEETHFTRVLVLHDAVEQLFSLTIALAVWSVAPKLTPRTVAEAPPLIAVFRSPNEATGASNVNLLDAVPATAPTVTTILASAPASL